MPYQAQLPLFNRQAVVVRHIPGDLPFPCETLLADFLANRKARPVSLPPSESIQEPDDEFRQHPPIDLLTAASTYL